MTAYADAKAAIAASLVNTRPTFLKPVELQTLIVALTDALLAELETDETSIAGKASKSANLSDLANASTALDNLGLTGNGKSLVTAANYAAMKVLLATAISDVTGLQTALDLKAPLASPGLTGVPTTPTVAGTADSTTKIASTAFVQAVAQAKIDALVNSAPGTLDTLAEIATALLADEGTSAALATTVAGKLAKSSNLSDLTNAGTALDNLGLSANGKSLVTAANYAAMKVLLALTPGTDVQAYHANLAALAGLTGAASKIPGFTGAGAMALLSYGTGANNLVQLDGSSRLPAVDGSLLTGLASGASTTSALTNNSNVQGSSCADALNNLLARGRVYHTASRSTQTGALLADGSAYSRSTYASLFAELVKSATVTISIASPGVVSWTGHGLRANEVYKSTTTGAIPTGLTAGTKTVLTANTFTLSATPGGTAINTTGSQSGVHTGISAPFGDGDGSTTFNVPNLMDGSVIRGLDLSGSNDANRTFGASQADAMQGHKHAASSVTVSGASFQNGAGAFLENAGTSGNPVTDGTNGTPRTAAETRMRNVALFAYIVY